MFFYLHWHPVRRCLHPQKWFVLSYTGSIYSLWWLQFTGFTSCAAVVQVVGDERWAGRFGIDADFVALEDCQVCNAFLRRRVSKMA